MFVSLETWTLVLVLDAWKLLLFAWHDWFWQYWQQGTQLKQVISIIHTFTLRAVKGYGILCSVCGWDLDILKVAITFNAFRPPSEKLSAKGGIVYFSFTITHVAVNKWKLEYLKFFFQRKPLDLPFFGICVLHGWKIGHTFKCYALKCGRLELHISLRINLNYNQVLFFHPDLSL